MSLQKVNLAEKFSQFSDYCNPRIAGQVNECAVKLVKMKGEFLWHHHEQEDEMFLVVHGRFTMRLRTGDLEIREGEFIIIPCGVEHCPVAEEEVHIVLFEPKDTLNTGNVQNERTREKLQAI